MDNEANDNKDNDDEDYSDEYRGPNCDVRAVSQFCDVLKSDSKHHLKVRQLSFWRNAENSYKCIAILSMAMKEFHHEPSNKAVLKVDEMHRQCISLHAVQKFSCCMMSFK